MTRTIAVMAAVVLMLLAAPGAEAKTPGSRDVKRAAHKLRCEIAGPESFAGPKNHGVLCWQHDRPVEEPTDGRKTYVVRYRNADAAADYWADFLGGQGCVAQKGRIIVIPADRTWYDCGFARKAARRLHGSVITG